MVIITGQDWTPCEQRPEIAGRPPQIPFIGSVFVSRPLPYWSSLFNLFLCGIVRDLIAVDFWLFK